MTTLRLQVKGMGCELCENSIEKALREKGVTGKADAASGTVTVEYDDNDMALEQIKATIREHGYKVV